MYPLVCFSGHLVDYFSPTRALNAQPVVVLMKAGAVEELNVAKAALVKSATPFEAQVPT